MRIATATFLLAILVGCGGPARPDVLLVTVDTLRADHTAAFGYDLPTTPELLALARRGVAFDRCESQHPETGPSLSSLLTSRYPREIGVRENGRVLPEAYPTLPEVFRAAGYRTGAFVSTYLLKPHACGLERGFDVYDARMTAKNLGRARFERPARETIDAARGFMREGPGPWFLWVHLYEPHGLYDPEPATASRFYRRSGRPPLAREQIVSYQRFGDRCDPDDYVARYDGEIHVADREIGRLLAAVGEDTIVSFTADHGEGLGEHGYWFRHGSRLDGPALHVPLVLAGPGCPVERRIGSLVRNLDVGPTLLDLAGLPPLPGARGISLRPQWSTRPVGRPSFAEARRLGGVGDRHGVDTRYKVSVRDGGHRLLFWPESGESRLYDLSSDASEERDLSSTHPEIRERLLALLRDWLRLGDEVAGRRPPPDVGDALRGLGYLR